MSGTPISTIDGELLRKMRWLRRLATDLVGAEMADDLVQETCVAALATPPAMHHPVRPWLARVMRNLVYMNRRTRVRRERRETAGSEAPVADPSAEVLVERTQRLTVVLESLEAVSDPYGSTLRSLYLEDVSTAELAQREGVGIVTIRWRKKKALERLRKELDRRHGSRQRWLGALAPVISPSAWAGAALSTGVVSMKASTKVALALALGSLALGSLVVVVGAGGTNDQRRPKAAEGVPVSDAGGRLRASDNGDVARRNAWARKLASLEGVRIGRVPDAPRDDGGIDGDELSEHQPHADDPQEQLPAPDDLGAQIAALGCFDDQLPTNPKGRVKLKVHYVGAPDVGTVVESIEFIEDSVAAPQFTECLSNSLYMLDFEPPTKSGRGSANVEYAFGEDGPAAVFPLFKSFMEGRPDLIVQYPFLGSVAQLPDDAPVSQWLNEDFLRALAEDPAFAQDVNAFMSEGLGVPCWGNC